MKRFIKNNIKAIYRFLCCIYRLVPLSQQTKARIKSLSIRGLTRLLSTLNPGGVDLDHINVTDPDYKDKVIHTYKQYIDGIFQIGQKSAEFKEYKQHSISFTDYDVKPIAFYLPQFYTFPENDEWWGKGFTEWTNVTKSVPQFVGHYQPHLPYDSTFYDLSNVDVIQRQMKLARNYGIYGFCFHYYWFNGKRLLEKPLNNFFNSDIDFHFCINWANENWTRKWDGSDEQILIAQKHSDEDDLACIAEICKYIRDKRYIKVNGRPLIIIYNVAVLPNANKTIKIWRKYCRENEIGEICIAVAQIYPLKNSEKYSFDVAVEFPPHVLRMYANNITYSSAPLQNSHSLNIYNIEEYINEKYHFICQPRNAYKCVFPSWDNTPRRAENGSVYQTTPALYKKWLLDCMKYTKQNREPGDRLVFINAWNEWAEGAHLEPDRKYGYAYLQATADSIIESKNE